MVREYTDIKEITMQKLLLILLAVILLFGGAYIGLSVANDANYTDMLEYIDTFPALEGAGEGLTVGEDAYGNICITADRDLKILQITDIHLGGGVFYRKSDRSALNAVAAMISAERPDLVVLTGDMCSTYPMAGTLDNSLGHDYIIRLMERLGVYWTVTLGNHDNEPYNIHGREYVSSMYADPSLEYCLYSESPEGISGYGNHVINILSPSGEVRQSLFMIDSHAYTGDNIIDSLAWNYDHIKEDQIEWFKSTAELYSPVSTLLFFHIPLTEVREAYNEYVDAGREPTDNVLSFSGHDGEEGDVVYCSETAVELFDEALALSERLGTRVAMFFGHDHFNNFVMDYKGVILSYGYSVDYMAYGDIGNKGYQRGCTVITAAADGGFDIAHENYYQSKYVPLYEKEVVDMYPYFDK